MRHEVSVSFDGLEWLDIPVHADEVLAPEDARRWLDEEFVRQDCSPLRASGKVLTADKVLALAATVGPEGFREEAWRTAFARAASGALVRPLVKVDVAAMTVSY